MTIRQVTFFFFLTFTSVAGSLALMAWAIGLVSAPYPPEMIHYSHVRHVAAE